MLTVSDLLSCHLTEAFIQGYTVPLVWCIAPEHNGGSTVLVLSEPTTFQLLAQIFNHLTTPPL